MIENPVAVARVMDTNVFVLISKKDVDTKNYLCDAQIHDTDTDNWSDIQPLQRVFKWLVCEDTTQDDYEKAARE